MLLQLLLLLVCLAAQLADAAGFATAADRSRSRLACRDGRLQQVTLLFGFDTSLKVHSVDDGHLHGTGTEISCVEAISEGCNFANGAISSTPAGGRNRNASRSASLCSGGYAYAPALRRRRGISNRRPITPGTVEELAQSPFERSTLPSLVSLSRNAPTGAVPARHLHRRRIWCLKSLRDDQAIISEKLAEVRADGSTAMTEDDSSVVSAARPPGAEADADADKQIDTDVIDCLKKDIENVRIENEALMTENKLLKRVTGDLIGNLRDLAELLGDLDDCRLEATARVEQTLFEAAEQFPEEEELSSYEWLTKR